MGAPATPSGLLAHWLRARLEPGPLRWLTEAQAAEDRAWSVAFALVPRRIGTDPLALEGLDRAQAAAARSGWEVDTLRLDQAARLLLLLSGDDPARIAQRVERVLSAAALEELITCWRGLPLYPEPGRYQARAADGLRSNIPAVFAAIAHRNPYPAEVFGESTWNHLVLKCLFIALPLWPIQGLEQRANPELSRMLLDYAAERRAAGRSVSPELWRCVGACPGAEGLAQLAELLASGRPVERRAAAAALHGCPERAAQEILARAPELAADAATLDWRRLAAEAGS